jgi:hypothetical protein
LSLIFPAQNKIYCFELNEKNEMARRDRVEVCVVNYVAPHLKNQNKNLKMFNLLGKSSSAAVRIHLCSGIRSISTAGSARLAPSGCISQ